VCNGRGSEEVIIFGLIVDVFPELCKIGLKLMLITNRKSHMCFLIDSEINNLG